MENTDSTLELQRLILEFNKNPENQKLIDYYTSKSFFEILSKPRSETVHSSFLAWILEGKDFSTGDLDSPVMGLLDIISEKRLQNNSNSAFNCYYGYKFPDDLLENVLSRSAIVTVNSVTTEQVLPGESNTQENRLDIVLRCTVNNHSKNEKLLIVIENKIGSTESSKTDKNNNTIWQTRRYFCIINDQIKSNYDHMIFVFLTPPNAEEPICKNFVHITYQDIMDRILDPLSNSSKLSDKAKVLIQDYIKTLSVPALNEENDENNTSYSVLAVGKEEQEKLSNFAENNKDLISCLNENYNRSIVNNFKTRYRNLFRAVLNVPPKNTNIQTIITHINNLYNTSGTHIVSIEFKKSGTKIWKVGTMTDISEFIILNLWEHYKNQTVQNIFQQVQGIVINLRVSKKKAYVLCRQGHSSDKELTPDKTQPGQKVYVYTQWRLEDGSSPKTVNHNFHYDDPDVEIILKRIKI